VTVTAAAVTIAQISETLGSQEVKLLPLATDKWNCNLHKLWWLKLDFPLDIKLPQL